MTTGFNISTMHVESDCSKWTLGTCFESCKLSKTIDPVPVSVFDTGVRNFAKNPLYFEY